MRRPVALRGASVAMSFTGVLLTVALACTQTARAQSGPPLFSEGFETGFTNDPYCKSGDCNVPAGWGVWFIPRTENDPPGINAQPKYDAVGAPPSRVKSGASAQRIWTDNATHTGGIFRVVKDVQVGAKLRFSAWGQVWSTNDESPISARPSRDIRLKIGIDPLGGNDGNPSPLNGQVVWSPEQSPADAFVQFSVEVEARSSTVIVYTYATMREAVRHNEVFWDDAVLEYIAPPPTATPAAVAPAITATVDVAAAAPMTPTEAPPVETAAVTYTIKSGDTLFGIALDQNVGLEDLLKNNPGVQAENLQIGQVLIVKPGVAAPPPTPPADAQPALDPNAVNPGVAATDTVTATPTVGKACVQAFFDDNGNGKKDDTEDLVPNILFTVSASGQQKGSYTSNGVDEPYCFDNLDNGEYTVAATTLDIYAPTTPLNDTLVVRGARAFFSLGLRRVIDGNVDVSKPEQTETPGEPINWRAVLPIAGGALLLVGAAGFGASLFMRRRRL